MQNPTCMLQKEERFFDFPSVLMNHIRSKFRESYGLFNPATRRQIANGCVGAGVSYIQQISDVPRYFWIVKRDSLPQHRIFRRIHYLAPHVTLKDGMMGMYSGF